MKFTALLTASAACVAPAAAAACSSWDYLEGFAKDNPVGPTTGGAGGETVTVTNAAEFSKAVAGDVPRIVRVAGNINGTARHKVGSNKTILGVQAGNATLASVTGVGVNINSVTNVIVRNIRFSGVLDNDCITIQNSTRVWIDHNEFASLDFPAVGPDHYDGQLDIVRASDWITVSWNYFHDHWKSSLVGNSDALRDVDQGHLHVSYHHNHWRNEGTRGPAGRFGHQHVYNNFYEDFRFQAIHSRSDNQVLVEANVFRGNTREALSTYGLVIPDDSPNTCVCGDEEIDGFANLGALNDFGPAGVNITQVGNFTKAPYEFKLTPLAGVQSLVMRGAGIGKISV